MTEFLNDERLILIINNILADTPYKINNVSDLFIGFNYPALIESIIQKQIPDLERNPTEIYEIIENISIVNKYLCLNYKEYGFVASNDPREAAINALYYLIILAKNKEYTDLESIVLLHISSFRTQQFLTRYMYNYCYMCSKIYKSNKFTKYSQYSSMKEIFDYAEIPFIFLESDFKSLPKSHKNLNILQLHFILKYFNEYGEVNKEYKKVKLRNKLIKIGFTTPSVLFDLMIQIRQAFYKLGISSLPREKQSEDSILKLKQTLVSQRTDLIDNTQIYTDINDELDEKSISTETTNEIISQQTSFSDFDPIQIYTSITHLYDYVALDIFQKNYSPDISKQCYFPIKIYQDVDDKTHEGKEIAQSQCIFSYDINESHNFCLNNIPLKEHFENGNFFFIILGNDEIKAQQIINYYLGDSSYVKIPSNNCIMMYLCKSNQKPFYILRVVSKDNSLSLTERIFYEKQLLILHPTQYHIVTIMKSVNSEALPKYYAENVFNNENTQLYFIGCESPTPSNSENHFYYKENSNLSTEEMEALSTFIHNKNIQNQNLSQLSLQNLFKQGLYSNSEFSEILQKAFPVDIANIDLKIMYDFYLDRFYGIFGGSLTPESMAAASILAFSFIYNTFNPNPKIFLEKFKQEINKLISFDRFRKSIKESLDYIEKYCKTKKIISKLERRAIIDSFKQDMQKTIYAYLATNNDISNLDLSHISSINISTIISFFPIEIFNDEIDQYIKQIQKIFDELDQLHKECSHEEETFKVPLNYVMRESLNMRIMHIKADAEDLIPPDG